MKKVSNSEAINLIYCKIFEGDEHKVEATLHVDEAIPKHGGKYQCNKLHKNYHTLRVETHKENTDEYFEPFPYIPVEETDGFTTIDEPIFASSEIVRPTTRHHHHHSKIIPEILENVGVDVFKVVNYKPNSIPTDFDFYNGSVVEFTTPLAPISHTTTIVDDIETDEDYDDERNSSEKIDDDDKLFKENELPENKEKMTNTESNNIIIDGTDDVLNEFGTTIVTEDSIEENENPLSASPSLVTITVTTELTVPDLVVFNEHEPVAITKHSITSTVDTPHIEPSLTKGERSQINKKKCL